LTEHLGGNQFAYLLLGPLEKLCYVEDIAVRDQVLFFIDLTIKAAQNFKKVCKLIDFKKHEELISQTIKRLVNGDFHTAKGAASSIISGIFPCKL
jgi:serine/threonine-protein phosphatase 2A regulatory subunit A